jgi:hypothetical protein
MCANLRARIVVPLFQQPLVDWARPGRSLSGDFNSLVDREIYLANRAAAVCHCADWLGWKFEPINGNARCIAASNFSVQTGVSSDSYDAMKTRRNFFKSALVLGALGTTRLPLAADTIKPAPANFDDRRYWLSVTEKLARPVLENLARRELKKNMPVEEQSNAGRATFSHLEAFGRLLCGIAPWLACENLSGDERKLQQEFIELAQTSLDAATNAQSPDFMNFSQGDQPLVDTAFLAQGILRAPKVLWEPIEPRVKRQVIEAFKSSRKIATPAGNNWVMFAATIEAALLEFGEPTLPARLEDCVRKMLGWYCGDGAYGDGQFFHFDYYNSYVIQPMLLDVLAVLEKHDPAFAPAWKIILQRAKRYAEIQERLIAPDGTFPALGRSTAYRFGAFQVLAQIAWQHELPEKIKPAQVRGALTSVIRKLIEAPGTLDADGWLQIGFYGHQPALGEKYVSTGSLYLCSAGLLPLGLHPTDEFWRAPAVAWTQQKIWAGENVPADHAIADVLKVELPNLKREK